MRVVLPPRRLPLTHEGGPRVVGFDTETCYGWVMVLACSDGTYIETCDTDALLDWLYERAGGADYSVFWNVKFDVGCILKAWLVAHAEDFRAKRQVELRKKKELRLLRLSAATRDTPDESETQRIREATEELEDLETVERFDTDRWSVRIIGSKGFILQPRGESRHRKKQRCFFDAMPFWASGATFGNAAGLDATARKYLSVGKNAEEEGVDRQMIGDRVGYYDAHREAIIKYCVRDCELTRDLFYLTLKAFDNIGLPFPERPWSRASISREYLKQDGGLEATAKQYAELSKLPLRYLWERAYAGGCIYTRGVGTWREVTKYDINSAYPAEMARLPSLEGASVVPQSDPRFNACYLRFYAIKLTPTVRRALRKRKRLAEEFWSTDDAGGLQYVSGGSERYACVTALDLQLFDLWGDHYTIIDAVGIVTPSAERPFYFMADMYARKTEIKARFPAVDGHDSPEYLNSKIVMNGCYGIVAQRRPTTTVYTNFIYASYITARCRLTLWTKAHEIERAGGTVLSFMTDGLFAVDAPPAQPSKTLGEWDAEPVQSVTLFANGLYVQDGHLKRRGAPYLTIEELYKCRRPYISVTHAEPCSIKQAVARSPTWLPPSWAIERSAQTGDRMPAIPGPAWLGVFVPTTKNFQPAEMLLHSGGRVTPEWLRLPLREYFIEQSSIEPRGGDEPEPVTLSWAQELYGSNEVPE